MPPVERLRAGVGVSHPQGHLGGVPGAGQVADGRDEAVGDPLAAAGRADPHRHQVPASAGRRRFGPGLREGSHHSGQAGLRAAFPGAEIGGLGEPAPPLLLVEGLLCLQGGEEGAGALGQRRLAHLAHGGPLRGPQPADLDGRLGGSVTGHGLTLAYRLRICYLRSGGGHSCGGLLIV
jgi:hypothetical protein